MFYILIKLAISAFLIASTMAVNSNYEGLYKLTSLYDTETGEVALPENEITVRFQPGLDHQYAIGIKVGNSMGSTITVSDSSEPDRDAVSVGPVRSTMMMPPQEQYAVEKALSKILPAMEFLHLERGDDMLVMEGSKGSMQCLRSSN